MIVATRLLVVLASAILAGTPLVEPLPPLEKGTVVIRTLSDPWTLNLVTATDASAQEIHGYIYETLLYTDPYTLENIPWLAESAPVASRDHMSYDVHLRKNARFSDGTPVTGEDIIFYVKAVKNPMVPEAMPMAHYLEDIDRVEIVGRDPYHLRIVMRKPYFLASEVIGGLYALPKHVWDPKGISDKVTFAMLKKGTATPAIERMASIFTDVKNRFNREKLIGSGPYIFESFSRNERVVLRRDSNYWNMAHQYGKNFAERIVYRTLMDEHSAITSLKNGDIDVMPTMEKQNYRSLENVMDEYGLKPAIYDYSAYSYIGYNGDSPIFSDKRVRNALSRAVDRKSIIDDIYFGHARPVQSPVYYRRLDADTTLPSIQYDLRETRRMLGEAGWSDNNRDGVLDKTIDGTRVDFRFTIMTNAGNQARLEIAHLFANALKRIGVEATVTSQEWAAFIDRTRRGEFDAYIGGWVMSVTEGDLYQIWHSKSIQDGSNYVRFRNKEVDQLIEKARAEFDARKRYELTRRIQRIIHDEQPYTFLVSMVQTGAYSSRFKNVEFFAPRPCFNAGWWKERGE